MFTIKGEKNMSMELTSLNINLMDFLFEGTEENSTSKNTGKEWITQLFINEIQNNISQKKQVLPSGVIKISRKKYVDLDTSYIIKYTSNKKDIFGNARFTNNVKDYDIKIYSIVHGPDGILGEGGQKIAKKMIDFDTGKNFVILKFKNSSAYELQTEDSEMIKALQLVKELPFVSGGQFAILTSYEKYNRYGVILSEYAEDYLDKAIAGKTGKLSIEKKMKYAQELLTGLDAMHKKEVVHRDIKPSNINITEGVAHLTDLDFATTKLERGRIADGSAAYIAPEIYNKMISNFNEFKPGDVYQLGVTLYEMFNEKHPWLDDSTDKLKELSNEFFADHLLKMNKDDFENFWFPEPKKGTIDHLIWEMKHIDPKLRPTAEEALNRLNALYSSLANSGEPEKDTIDHQVWQQLILCMS